MKTIDEIINQEPVYLHEIESSKKIGLISWMFNILPKKEGANFPYLIDEKIEELGNINILFATLSEGNCEGSAFVLFEKDGLLFEVNAWHSSIDGFEGQWEPEPTTLEELAYRLTVGTMGRYSDKNKAFASELKQFLGIN